MLKQKNKQTGKPLSKSTIHSTVMHLKAFFQWLAMQPGYKVRVNYSDAEYFNLSEKDKRIATTKRGRSGPTLEQVKHVITNMPDNTPIERRNKAVIAFILLTGARDRAVTSFKLKHVDIDAGFVDHDNREVMSKFSKSFVTYFFPVGDEVKDIVIDWVNYLRNELLWGRDDPLFPQTEITLGDNHCFEAIGLKRENWSNATPIRKIFKEAFTDACLPYFNPHLIRKTLATLGSQLCKTPETFKAWSQNLGHENVLITLTSYGEVNIERQSEIIKSLSLDNKKQSDDEELVQKIIQLVQKS